MEPTTTISVITAVIPILTAGLKKLLHTERWTERSRKSVHSIIPVLLGILSAGLYEASRGSDWMTALAVGLGSGGAASSVRDIDRHVTRIFSAVHAIPESRKEDHPED